MGKSFIFPFSFYYLLSHAEIIKRETTGVSPTPMSLVSCSFMQITFYSKNTVGERVEDKKKIPVL